MVRGVVRLDSSGLKMPTYERTGIVDSMQAHVLKIIAYLKNPLAYEQVLRIPQYPSTPSQAGGHQ